MRPRTPSERDRRVAAGTPLQQTRPYGNRVDDDEVTALFCCDLVVCGDCGRPGAGGRGPRQRDQRPARTCAAACGSRPGQPVAHHLGRLRLRGRAALVGHRSGRSACDRVGGLITPAPAGTNVVLSASWAVGWRTVTDKGRTDAGEQSPSAQRGGAFARGAPHDGAVRGHRTGVDWETTRAGHRSRSAAPERAARRSVGAGKGRQSGACRGEAAFGEDVRRARAPLRRRSHAPDHPGGVGVRGERRALSGTPEGATGVPGRHLAGPETGLSAGGVALRGSCLRGLVYEDPCPR